MSLARERLQAALSFQEADRVPVIPFVLGAARRVAGISFQEWSLDPELAARAMMESQELLGYDILFAVLDTSVEASAFGAEMVYPTDSTAHPDYRRPLLKSVEDYARLEPFDPLQAPRTRGVLRTIEILVRERGEELPVMGLVMGVLCVLSMLRGNEEIFKDCLRHPQEVKAALEVVTESHIRYLKAQADRGVEGFCLQQLYPSRSIMSRRLWEEIEAPFSRQIVQEIRRLGMKVTVHNCGDGPYFDAMIEQLQPDCISFSRLPDDCRDYPELKEKYGRQVALAGHVDCPNTLMFGTPRDVREECRRQIEGLARGGGFILASGCEVPPNVPLGNLRAMVEAAQTYGTYR